MSYAKGKNFNVVFLPLRYSAGDTYRGSGLVVKYISGKPKLTEIPSWSSAPNIQLIIYVIEEKMRLQAGVF